VRKFKFDELMSEDILALFGRDKLHGKTRCQN